MTEFERDQEHIRHTHNAFCRIVIRHTAIDAARNIRSRRDREISPVIYRVCAALCQSRIASSAKAVRVSQ